uniref:Ankyrin-like protein n=1 Tax=Oryza sativa subsp. japonica TaxID=39947 RepID=Q6K4I4_ORYSJ|nr:ankyrin-like protein [Oryza sativa Japonica Group]
MARGLDTGQGEAAVVAAVEGSGFGHRALHMAASGGSVDVLRYLVEDLCLGVNQFNGKGQTPLFLSSIHGRAAATRYLLDHGSNPAIDKIVLPLHGAAVKGHCEIVELFLSKGVDVDLYSIAGTPLLAAAISGQHSTMKILLEHHADVGADMNFRDSNGVTCVMVAANHGSSVIMKCLLDAGANPNIPDEFNTTPIEVAANHGRRDIVEMLFPLTSPISTLSDWSIDGIISHVENFGLKPRDNDLSKRKSAELKLQAREAFERNDYALAVQHYTNAIELSTSAHDKATLLANRSLCWLRLSTGIGAIADANMCRMLRPSWPKACYRQGAAFMFIKDYGKACEAFADGLKLDPANEDIKKALRDAEEAMKKDKMERRG